MPLAWRAVTQADLEQCLAIDPRSMGDRLIGRDNALKIWRNLLKNLSFNAAIVESEGDAHSRKTVCFGASVFLKSDYADRELQCPQPDLNSRIFASIQAQHSVLHSVRNLFCNQRESDLELLLLSSSFQLSALSSVEAEEASLLLPRALVHLHIGYPIRRILMETTNERMRLSALSSGLWKMISDFPSEERSLMAVTREEALGAAGFSVLGPLFRYRRPKLELRDTEKQLLCEAIHGETDVELALRLGLSVSSIKKRWSTLYARIAMVLPQLLPDGDSETSNDSRGSQKRHRILAYARDHPEELRPFRWYPYEAVGQDD